MVLAAHVRTSVLHRMTHTISVISAIYVFIVNCTHVLHSSIKYHILSCIHITCVSKIIVCISFVVEIQGKDPERSEIYLPF